MARSFYVRCWLCGKVARRVPGKRMPVVGQRRTVQTYGRCNSIRDPEWTCEGVMVRPRDLRRVVRAAIAWERAGHNKTSEYDL